MGDDAARGSDDGAGTPGARIARDPVLVRCARCGRNFETRRFGSIACANCHAEVFLEAPAGVVWIDHDPGEAPPSEPEPGSGRPETSQPQALEPSESPGDGGEETAAEAQRSFVPAWEQNRGSWPWRFAQTVKQVLLTPSLFFGTLRVDRFYRSLSYGWILCTFAVFFFALYATWQIDRNRAEIAQNLHAQTGTDGQATDPEALIDQTLGIFRLSMFLSPLLGLLNALLMPALFHAGIWLLAHRNRGFRATFRASSYGFTPMLLFALPVMGYMIGWIWALVLQMLALSQVHRISTLRASLATVLPISAAMLILFWLV